MNVDDHGLPVWRVISVPSKNRKRSKKSKKDKRLRKKLKKQELRSWQEWVNKPNSEEQKEIQKEIVKEDLSERKFNLVYYNGSGIVEPYKGFKSGDIVQLVFKDNPPRIYDHTPTPGNYTMVESLQ